VLNSFYVHNSVEVPPKRTSLDLHQILLRNPKHCTSKIPDSAVSSKNDGNAHESDGSPKGGSGWDVVRSISKSTSYYTSTPQFKRIWWDKGCDLRCSVSIWRPITRPGFASLGDCITEGFDTDLLVVFVFSLLLSKVAVLCIAEL
jgi:vacuolar protein sorting-associated protein 13A/C